MKKRAIIEGGGKSGDNGKGSGKNKDDSDDAQLKKGLENTIL